MLLNVIAPKIELKISINIYIYSIPGYGSHGQYTLHINALKIATN